MCVNGASREKRVFCNYLCFGWQPALGGEYKENNASILFPNNIYGNGKVLVKEEYGIYLLPFMTLRGAFVEHHKVPSGVHRNGNMMAFFLCFNILSLYQ